MVQKSYERIKNFSTTISVEKTIGEIEMILARHGATKVMKEYDGDGNPDSLTFAIRSAHGELPIKLPCNSRKVEMVFEDLVKEGRLPRKFVRGEWSERQAARVAWRNIKDWVYAQLTLLQIGMVKMEEIFMPYIYNLEEGKTMFELLEDRGFSLKALPKGKEDQR